MVSNYLSLIEAEIKKKKYGDHPTSLYEPIRYIMSLGGKRLRPLLTTFSYALYKNDVEEIIPYAVAVEAFHNFTLLHDDIMDNAPLRRNKPTVHEKWNINTAILSGDVMLVKVYEMFLGLEKEKIKKVLEIFSQCASGVCEGQQLDMDYETKKKVSEAQYLEMIRLKTAVLLGFSLELGAVLANAPESDCKTLRELGINIGMGFQLKDDWLDVYADKKKFGKQVGGDIVANKKTFLLITALEKARGKQKRTLEKWLALQKFNKKEKIKAIATIYDSLQISILTQRKINFFFKKGLSSINSLSNPKKAQHLKEFIERLIDREN